MERKFKEAVIKACYAEDNTEFVNQVMNASHREVVESYVLPRIFNESGQYIRGWRISPTAMTFVAKWADYCVKQDRFTGELLLELAMDRISCGAMLHESYNYVEAFKEAGYGPYLKYSVLDDQPGLIDEECWQFLKAHLEYCLTEMSVPQFKDHAEKILWGILEHASEDGEPLGGLTWNETLVKTATLKDIYVWAEQLAIRLYGADKVAEHLASDWQWIHHRTFFKKYGNGMADNHPWWWWFSLTEDKLPYEERFNGLTRGILKVFGQYDKVVASKVKKSVRKTLNKA